MRSNEPGVYIIKVPVRKFALIGVSGDKSIHSVRQSHWSYLHRNKHRSESLQDAFNSGEPIEFEFENASGNSEQASLLAKKLLEFVDDGYSVDVFSTTDVAKPSAHGKSKKKVSFTLMEDSIATLTKLSEIAGISRSSLLDLLLECVEKGDYTVLSSFTRALSERRQF